MAQVIQTIPKPTCPVCGSIMVLRRPKPHQDWSPFWGCPDYPDCQGVREIMPDGTPEEDDEFILGEYGMDW